MLIVFISSDNFVTPPSVPNHILPNASMAIAYTISFARVIKDYQIPYAIVTDGENARIFYTLSGSLVRESIDGIFQKQEAVELMNNFKKIPCPAKRFEKEKRIIYAFEGIKCPTVQQ